MARRAGLTAATKRALEAAHTSFQPVTRSKTQGYTIQIANNKTMTLLNSDGSATASGRYYYETILDLPLPTTFAYEQELIDGKWVEGFNGEKILIRRRDSEGNWQPTQTGLNYYRYLRDEYVITVPSARPQRGLLDVILESLGPFTLSEQYFTVPYLRTPAARTRMRGLASEQAKLDFVKAAALAYLRSRPVVRIGIALTPFHVIHQDSTPIVWMEDDGEITYSRKRIRVHNVGPTTTETILNRPLLDYSLPEGAWRPFDLHRNSFRKFEVGCVVQMIFDCFLVRKKASGASRRAGFPSSTLSHGATIREIEEDFDTIFDQLGYVNGKFPFEHSWRRCGATPQMVLEYARLHSLKCYVHFKDNIVATFLPTESSCHTPTINFSCFANHAYYYATEIGQRGSTANNATCKRGVKSEQPEVDCFSDKQISKIFGAELAPRYEDWKSMAWLVEALGEGGEALRYSGEGSDREVAIHKRAYNRTPRFFCNSPASHTRYLPFDSYLEDILLLAERKKGGAEAFSVRLMFGNTPEKVVGCTIQARDCPKLVCKSVPLGAQLLLRICEFATTSLALSPNCLVYRGQSMGTICEQLRVFFAKANRCKRSGKERAAILHAQGGKCSTCDAVLLEGAFEIDHIRALSDGGDDTPGNCRATCTTCHAAKSQEERLSGIVSKPLLSDFSVDILEALIAAPKPRQLVWGDGSRKCIAIDAVRSRTNALVHNTIPIPVACVLDKPQRWCEDPDFLFVDVGAGSLEMAPYFGPAWYWKESYEYMLERRICRRADVVCVVRASEHAPPDSLKEVYSQIEGVVAAALEGQELSTNQFDEDATHDPRSILKFTKAMMLSMQGAWLARSMQSWNVTNSTCSEDAEGVVVRTRQNSDGTTAFMSCKHIVSNSSMYLVGLVTLHKEHLMLAKLMQALGKPRGGCVDCLYYDHADRARCQAVIDTLRYPDGSRMWQIKDEPAAPQCELTQRMPRVTQSLWCDHSGEHDLKRWAPASFGDWSQEQRFAHERTWRVVTEPEGLGRFEGDDFQSLAAQEMADNEGGVCVGRGGSGKSEVLKRLRKILEERGWTVHVCAFTHVAAANCDGVTILRQLHQRVQSKRCAVLVDEASMVSLKIWAALAKMHSTGNRFFVFGDCKQFLPITDSHRAHLLEGIERSDFLHTLTNGLRVEVRRYRRGTDYPFFRFVGSLYDLDLPTALAAARERYPARGDAFDGTTLCVDHRCRVMVNERVNRRTAPAGYITLPAGEAIKGCANLPQDMRIWVGIVLVAVGQDKELKNGLRFQVVELSAEQLTLRGVDDNGTLLGIPFVIPAERAAQCLRLTHCLCYFSVQARTIKGPLRLAQTGHPYFTIRHLIVGCGRAPEGSVVEVE